MTNDFYFHRPTVVKQGTDPLLQKNGLLNEERIDHLIEQTTKVQEETRSSIFLVVSGAIAAGLAAYGRKRPQEKLTVAERKMYASAGNELYELIRHSLRRRGHVMNFLPLTRQDFHNAIARREMACTIQRILLDAQKSLIVINENDVTASDELQHSFGDNDILAGEVVRFIEAKTNIILGSTNGIQRDVSDPKSTIATFEDGDDQYIRHDVRSRNGGGSCGADIKISVGRSLAQEGVTTHIANGTTPGMLFHILLNGEKSADMNWTTIYPAHR